MRENYRIIKCTKKYSECYRVEKRYTTFWRSKEYWEEMCYCTMPDIPNHPNNRYIIYM